MFNFFSRKGPLTARISPGDKTIIVNPGDNLLKAALDNGVPWPYNCRVGSCGECRCRLVSGKIKPLNDFSYVLTGEELNSGMILACQTSLRSDVEIEISLPQTSTPLSQAKTVSGVISATQQLTHDILCVQIRLDEAMPAYLAGQYAELSIPGVIEKPRSYSFANAPETELPGHVSFYIRHVPNGEMTTWIHAQNRVGERVTITGPYGSFWLRESGAPMLCIAGGSGMAPIKALLEQVSQKGFGRNVAYVFGARTQEDLYCLDEMSRIKESGKDQFNFIPVLSREPEGTAWSGLRGNCTDALTSGVLDSCSFDLANCHAYLCGPPAMIDSAINMLVSNGVSKEHIFYDKFLDASTIQGGRN